MSFSHTGFAIDKLSNLYCLIPIGSSSEMQAGLRKGDSGQILYKIYFSGPSSYLSAKLKSVFSLLGFLSSSRLFVHWLQMSPNSKNYQVPVTESTGLMSILLLERVISISDNSVSTHPSIEQLTGSLRLRTFMEQM